MKPFLRLFSTKSVKPICANCINYIEYKHNYPYDELYTKYKYGKCAKFDSQNLVTGTIEYTPAALCRKDETKCGENGKHFTPSHFSSAW